MHKEYSQSHLKKLALFNQDHSFMLGSQDEKNKRADQLASLVCNQSMSLPVRKLMLPFH